MRTLMILFSSLVLLTVHSQDAFYAVNRDSVQQVTLDHSSNSYYPTLLQRFTAFDTSLTLEEYRLLYYGFAFQKQYQGYADHKKREILTAIQKADYKQVSQLCDGVLAEIPISLVGNYYKGYALYRLDSTDQTALKYRDRYQGLRNAILSSGDGLSCPTSFKVLFVSDEYDLLYTYFKIENVGTQSLRYPCDHFEISPSRFYQSSEIFFDASEPMLNLQKRTKKK